MKTPTIAVVGALALTSMLSGCISVRSHSRPSTPYAGSRSVNAAQFEEVMRQNHRVRLGMHRDEVLALYPADLLSLKSSASIEGAVVEEWQVMAIRSDWRNSFERWLYFVDGSLVEMRDSRLSTQGRVAQVFRWRGLPQPSEE